MSRPVRARAGLTAVAVVGAVLLSGCLGTPAPPAAANLAPFAFPAASARVALPGEPVNFTATGADLDGSILAWQWDFGDGENASSQNASHAYAHPGVYYVTLNATDDKGASFDSLFQTTVFRLRVEVFPSFTAATPADQPLARLALWGHAPIVRPGSNVTWSAAGSLGAWDARGRPVQTPASYSMDFGDGSAPESHAAAELASGSWDGNVSHAYRARGVYAASLTVTSTSGKSDTTVATVLVTVSGLPAGLPPNPDAIVIDADGEPTTLDPARAADAASWQVIAATYQTLVARLPGPQGGFTASLAEGLPQPGNGSSMEGLNQTFTLRSGVRFAGGADVRPEDVVYSFERLAAAGGGSAAARTLRDLLPSGSVTAGGGSNVTFHLARPYTDFFALLASPAASIVSRAVALPAEAASADWLALHTAGSGPFRLALWAPGQQLVLVASPDFSGPTSAASMDFVVLRNVPSLAARLMDLRTGNADIVAVSPTARALLDNTTQLAENHTVLGHGSRTWSLLGAALNRDVNVSARSVLGAVQSPDNIPSDFFADPRMREAFARSLDLAALTAGGGENASLAALNGSIPAGVYGHTDELTRPAHDMDAARAAYAASRWATDSAYNPGGLAGGFNLTLAYDAGDPLAAEAGATLKAGIEALGPNIHVNAVGLGAASYASTVFPEGATGPGPAPVFLFRLESAFASPDAFAAALAGPGAALGAAAGFADGAIRGLALNASALRNGSSRLFAYEQLEQALIDDGTFMVLGQPTAFLVSKDWIVDGGFDPSRAAADLGGDLAALEKR